MAQKKKGTIPSASAIRLLSAASAARLPLRSTVRVPCVVMTVKFECRALSRKSWTEKRPFEIFLQKILRDSRKRGGTQL